MDFWPRFARYHKQLWYLNWVIFVVVGLAVAVRHPQARSSASG